MFMFNWYWINAIRRYVFIQRWRNTRFVYKSKFVFVLNFVVYVNIMLNRKFLNKMFNIFCDKFKNIA